MFQLSSSSLDHSSPPPNSMMQDSPVEASPGPGPEKEARLVEEVENKSQGLVAGEVYYILCEKWYSQWCHWSRSPHAAERPKAITNAELIDTSNAGQLVANLIEHQDYRILAQGVWELLHSWYGGGPPIPRRAISQAASTTVEVYLLRMLVHRSTSSTSSPTAIFSSKFATISSLKRQACEELKLESSKARMWDYFNKKRQQNLESKFDSTLEACNMVNDNEILLESQLEDGSWPREEPERSRYQYSGQGEITHGTPPVMGAVGLQNLGNTCFMASSIQCLSNVEVFREHFRTDKFKDDVNSAAFKTQGRLAEAFSQLLKNMWNPTTTSVAPREFKYQIGQFAEQFTGYRQHDSMEFIEYLLDGLKEDLNKVRGSKPFVELKEAEGRPDTVVAEEAKQNYLIRNNSFIDELFLGFYKSTVRCTAQGCDRVSVKFDPFLSIKVPLPGSEKERMTTLVVTVISKKSTMVRHRVQVPKSGTAQDLLEAAAQAGDVPAKDSILVEVHRNVIHKCFLQDDKVDWIRPADILVLYEVDEAGREAVKASNRWTTQALLEERNSDLVGCVVHVRKTKSRAYRELMGIPLVTSLPKTVSPLQAQIAVVDFLQAHIGLLGEGWTFHATTEHKDAEMCATLYVDNPQAVKLSRPVVYFVLDWQENALPKGVARLEELNTGSNSDRLNGFEASPAVRLEDCIQLFTETDTLSEGDAWYCNKCKEHREAQKTMEFWSLPPILLLQLKRFTYTCFRRDRLDTHVAFPLESLDMRPFVMQGAEGAIFDLAALSLHEGGLGGGHYIAYGRSSVNGRWYNYNDNICREVSPADVAREQTGCYVLLYIRRDQRPASWGTPALEP